MNRKDIICMAREAGADFAELPMTDAIVFYVDDTAWNSAALERFAALVAAASASVEREACAKVCEEQELYYWGSPEDQEWTPIDCADAIRARGNI